MARRVHRITEWAPRVTTRIKTACGRTGYSTHRSVSDFDTARGGHFEAVLGRKGVTCQSCKKTVKGGS